MDMHAEAVRIEARPSQAGLLHDISGTLHCEECETVYQLHYDDDAAASSSLWSALAREIITARHPHHAARIVLSLSDRF